jgi:nitrite reductase (NADH) small subunit
MAKRTPTRHIVAPAQDFPPGDRRIVTVNGREIGVFNLGGEFHALLNYCPHRAAPLCHGRVRPLVVPDGLHGRGYAREGEILKCPWHQWEFDIRTGEALYDPAMKVRTYEVSVEEGTVVLYI